jgi:hypothetical protein
MKRQALLIFSLAAFVWHGVAGAQAVGRAEIKDLPGGWTQLVSYDLAGLTVNAGEKSIAMEGKAFLNSQRNMLLVVESTSSGNNRPLSWNTMKCPEARPNYFTNDYGSNQTKRETQCLVVNTRYSSKTYLAENYPQVASALEKNGNLRFESGQLVRTWSGIRTGSYLKILLFKTSPFQLEAGGAKESSMGVDASLIAFGESLHQLAYESTSSVSGNFSLQLVNTIK